jgi:hypothetical protein
MYLSKMATLVKMDADVMISEKNIGNESLTFK